MTKALQTKRNQFSLQTMSWWSLLQTHNTVNYVNTAVIHHTCSSQVERETFYNNYVSDSNPTTTNKLGSS